MRTALVLVVIVPALVLFLRWRWRVSAKHNRDMQTYLKEPHWEIVHEHGFRGNPVIRSLLGKVLYLGGAVLAFGGFFLIVTDRRPWIGLLICVIGSVGMAEFVRRRDLWAKGVLAERIEKDSAGVDRATPGDEIRPDPSS